MGKYKPLRWCLPVPPCVTRGLSPLHCCPHFPPLCCPPPPAPPHRTFPMGSGHTWLAHPAALLSSTSHCTVVLMHPRSHACLEHSTALLSCLLHCIAVLSNPLIKLYTAVLTSHTHPHTSCARFARAAYCIAIVSNHFDAVLTHPPSQSLPTLNDHLLLLRCEHWLEAADEKHRYGSNLRWAQG